MADIVTETDGVEIEHHAEEDVYALTTPLLRGGGERLMVADADRLRQMADEIEAHKARGVRAQALDDMCE